MRDIFLTLKFMANKHGFPESVEAQNGRYEVSAAEIKRLIELGVELGKTIYAPDPKIKRYFINKFDLPESTVQPVDLADRIYFGKDVKPDELLHLMRGKRPHRVKILQEELLGKYNELNVPPLKSPFDDGRALPDLHKPIEPIISKEFIDTSGMGGKDKLNLINNLSIEKPILGRLDRDGFPKLIPEVQGLADQWEQERKGGRGYLGDKGIEKDFTIIPDLSKKIRK